MTIVRINLKKKKKKTIPFIKRKGFKTGKKYIYIYISIHNSKRNVNK
jgi:hypothetical protein